MKDLFNLNKAIAVVVISLQSSVGTAILIAVLVVVDGLGTAFGVASIFRERLNELNPQTAFKMSIAVGGLFAAVNLVGIVITSLKESMRGVNVFLTFVSAFLSFVGFIKFILPANFQMESLNFGLIVNLLIAFFLALVPAVVVKFASEDLTSDRSNNEEVKALTRDMTRQASALLRKKFEEIGNEKKNDFQIYKSKKAS